MSNRSGKDSRSAILAALAHGRLNWSKLRESTGLSKRTLATRLDELEREDLVIRAVDREARDYPPPVHYELTEHARARFKPLLDMVNFQKALGQLEAAIITSPTANVEKIVERANVFGGPVFTLFLRRLLEYDYSPDQIGTALALWYFPRVEVLTRKIYEELASKKEEAVAALDKELKTYAELITIPLRQVREAREREEGKGPT